MIKKSSNLAIVSNHSFEAAKAINLQHYDISSALQTTLELGELVTIFSNKIQDMIPHSGFVYINEEFDLEIKNGIATRNACSYAMKIEEQSLGELKLTRNQKFARDEIMLLETLLCCLIYPLRNAVHYRQALNMAYTDPLTQTKNRTAFNDSLKRESLLAHRNAKPLSLILLDIDHFKSVNDCFGHLHGDTALAAVASRIRETIRSCDMIFRYGGEEFVILLSDTGLEGAGLLAERIRQCIENHILSFDMETLKLTVSLGVSALHADDDIDALLARADHALYRAKKNGRNQVVTER